MPLRSRPVPERRPAIAAAAVVLFASMGASAALPPQYQRQREMVAIAESAEVIAGLAPHPIDRIESAGPDLYRVVAGDCRLQVRIVGEPQPMPGPRRFHLEVGPKTCR